MSESTDLLEALEADLAANRPFVLATAVATRGSTYRRAGARLLIRPDGSMVGSLSGGCVEADLAREAEALMEADAARLVVIDHGGADDAHLGWGLGCRGAIEVLLEPPSSAAVVADALRAARRAPVVLSTDPATGRHALGERREGWFIEELRPPVHLVICGEGPEAAALEGSGRALGWTVESSRTPADLPAVTERTCAILCSHRFEMDARFLSAMAASDAAYLGVVGPRARAEQLASETGVALDRLHAPAGLDVGAETPEEIALSVISEMLAVQNERTGASLRDREGPIH